MYTVALVSESYSCAPIGIPNSAGNVSMRFYHLLMFLFGLMICHSSVNAQFGWRCGYVGGWCGNSNWRKFESSGDFRSKARLMAALAKSVNDNMAELMSSYNSTKTSCIVDGDSMQYSFSCLGV
ncbi:hypothetical protein GCK32_011348 [Trichostrongylus colubriformis]|uniref:Uncharacterized protein n=1 Tax=Trichostrongylus colubriformis TaxID=6319 RepID=A0AAN8FYE1_TRICO